MMMKTAVDKVSLLDRIVDYRRSHSLATMQVGLWRGIEKQLYCQLPTKPLVVLVFERPINGALLEAKVISRNERGMEPRMHRHFVIFQEFYLHVALHLTDTINRNRGHEDT